MSEEKLNPGPAAIEAARRIFDYGHSVKWGSGKAALSQYEMAGIIEAALGDISVVLHERIQFYDSEGKPANAQVVADIEEALRQAWGGTVE